MKQKEAAEGRVARQALQEGRGWRDGPGVAASGMERRRHTGVLKVEGTGERMLPRWGLVRVVLPLRSRVGPGIRGACSLEDVSDQDSCVTRTVSILRITISSKCDQPGWGLRPLNPCLSMSV